MAVECRFANEEEAWVEGQKIRDDLEKVFKVGWEIYTSKITGSWRPEVIWGNDVQGGVKVTRNSHPRPLKQGGPNVGLYFASIVGDATGQNGKTPVTAVARLQEHFQTELLNASIKYGSRLETMRGLKKL